MGAWTGRLVPNGRYEFGIDNERNFSPQSGGIPSHNLNPNYISTLLEPSRGPIPWKKTRESEGMKEGRKVEEDFHDSA